MGCREDEQIHVQRRQLDMIVENTVRLHRMYEMFLGPVEQSKPGIGAVSMVYTVSSRNSGLCSATDNYLVTDEYANKELKSLHKLIKKVTGDIEQFSYNTSISAFMIA